MKEPLVQRFVQTLDYLNTSLDRGQTEQAHNYYRYLYTTYQAIQSSKLEQAHKDIARDKLQDAYSRLQHPEKKEQGTTPNAGNPLQESPSKIISKGPYYTKPELAGKTPSSKPGMKGFLVKNLKPRDFAIVTAFILLVAAVVFVKPEYVGLVSFDEGHSYTQEIDYIFTSDSDYIATLLGAPTSLRLSGKVKSGSAKIYLEHNGKRSLILDTDNKLLVQEGTFENVCEQTCLLEATQNKEARLIVDVQENSEVYLKELTYTIDGQTNRPPRWKDGQAKEIQMQSGQSLTLDLDKYFEDPDGDDLSYLTTGSEHLLVSLGQKVLTLTAKESYKGSTQITLVASDLKDIIRVPITITVE